MERRALGRDLGLSIRMGVALVLLAILYLPLPIGLVLLVQGWSGSWLLAGAAMAALVGFICYLPSLSERIALASAQARLIEREDEPRLFAQVERLASMADLVVPRLAVAPTDVPNAFTAGRSPRDAGRGRHARACSCGSATRSWKPCSPTSSRMSPTGTRSS